LAWTEAKPDQFNFTAKERKVSKVGIIPFFVSFRVAKWCGESATPLALTFLGIRVDSR